MGYWTNLQAASGFPSLHLVLLSCLRPWHDFFTASAGLSSLPTVGMLLPAPVLAWSAPWGGGRGEKNTGRRRQHTFSVLIQSQA